MGPAGEPSELFVGSFWAGTGPDFVCNRDYEGLGAEKFEWQSSPADPNGRVRDLGGASGQRTPARPSSRRSQGGPAAGGA